MRHSELPENLCSSQLDGLLGEDLVVCQCGHGGSRRAHGGERRVRARRLGELRRKWRQLRLQPRRGHRIAEAAMPAVASVTGTRAAARGAATHVKAAR